MAKAAKRSAAFYRAALLGVADPLGELIPGLRGVAKGFKAADGFNLRELKAGNWSPAMKRKVTMYYNEVQTLTAQTKVIVKTRSPERLRNAQAAGGHDPKFKNFKVAFVPGSDKARIEWTKDNTPIIREPGYKLATALFDRVELARDTKNEIARVLASKNLKGAKSFTLQCGSNLMLGEIPGREGMARIIRALMAKYNGIKDLPESSGNKHGANANPKNHHWQNWLVGVVGLSFDSRKTQQQKDDAINRIGRGNRALQKRRRNARRRKGAQ